MTREDAFVGKADSRMWQPSTKAPLGSKDENISPEEAKKIVGERWAGKIESLALAVYKTAHAFAVSNFQEPFHAFPLAIFEWLDEEIRPRDAGSCP